MKKKRKPLSTEQAEVRDAWLMMTPALIVLSLIAVYPIVRTVILSMREMVLTNPSSGYPFVGLENFIRIFRDPRALETIAFTFKFTITTVSIELVLGLVAALIMNRSFKGRGAVRAIVLIPWAIPTTVSALMWKFIYNDQYGMFNDILHRLGIIPEYIAWLSTHDGSFLALVISDVWKTTPYMSLLILAGLQMVPTQMYEAAKIDGAGRMQRFIHVTLPMIKDTVLVALLFRTLDAFRVFDLISVMTSGANGTESVSLYSYKHLMSFLDFGYGSALAVFIFVIVFMISLVYMRFLRGKIADL